MHAARAAKGFQVRAAADKTKNVFSKKR